MTAENIKLLLVESSAEDRCRVEELLGQIDGARFVIDSVPDTSRALNRLSEEARDLILAGGNHGGNAGIELLRQLRDRGDQTPFILLTRRDEPAVDKEALALGANDYLLKEQLNPSALERAIRYALAHGETLRKLRESEQRYRIAVKGSSDGIWDWDLRCNRMYLSERIESMLGYEKGELGDDPQAWFDRVHPEDRARMQREISEHLEGLTKRYAAEYRMLRKGGRQLWVLLRGRGIRDDHGTATRLAGSMSDITAWREADDRRISNIAQRLHEPLQALRQHLDVLLEGAAGELSDVQRDCVDFAGNDARRLDAMINDLMDTSQVEAGRLILHPRRFDLAAGIGHVLHPFYENARRVGLQLHSHVEEMLPEVFVDPDRVGQVLAGLVDKAIRYTGAGGVVTVRADRANAPLGFVHLSVSDTGPGMSSERARHVFDRTPSQKDGGAGVRRGLGLGLYLARELVRRHGGDIWLETAEGRGTMFHFTLPEFSLGGLLHPLLGGENAHGADLDLISIRIPAASVPPSVDGEFDLESRLQNSLLGGRELLLPTATNADGDALFFVVARGDGSDAGGALSRIEERLRASGPAQGPIAQLHIAVHPLAIPLSPEASLHDSVQQTVRTIESAVEEIVATSSSTRPVPVS